MRIFFLHVHVFLVLFQKPLFHIFEEKPKKVLKKDVQEEIHEKQAYSGKKNRALWCHERRGKDKKIGKIVILKNGNSYD